MSKLLVFVYCFLLIPVNVLLDNMDAKMTNQETRSRQGSTQGSPEVPAAAFLSATCVSSNGYFC